MPTHQPTFGETFSPAVVAPLDAAQLAAVRLALLPAVEPAQRQTVQTAELPAFGQTICAAHRQPLDATLCSALVSALCTTFEPAQCEAVQTAE